MLKIVTCSKSDIKIRATAEAIKRLGLGETCLASFEAKSSVSNQPRGLDEMRRGASNRVDYASHNLPGHDYYVAVENGMVQFGDGYFDAPCAVVRHNPTNGYARWSLSFGTFFPIPLWMAREVRETGAELGVIVQRRAGGEKDVMKYFSKDLLAREEILTQTIMSAFMEFLHEDLYRA